MSTLANLLTADDLLRLPSGGDRYELVRGELRTLVPAGYEHSNVGSELLMLLRQFAKTNSLGGVFGPDLGYILSQNPDIVRCPDVSFIRQQRQPEARLSKFFPGAPDLAVEVLSPSDTVDEVEEKLANYFAAGTHTVWVVKPRTQSIDVWTAGKLTLSLQPDDPLTHPQLLPGFECRVRSIFQ